MHGFTSFSCVTGLGRQPNHRLLINFVGNVLCRCADVYLLTVLVLLDRDTSRILSVIHHYRETSIFLLRLG